MIVFLAACSGPSTPAPPSEGIAPTIPLLDLVPLARRLSLDVRGIAPTLAEYHELLDDPDALDGVIDRWLADPRFEDRIVELYSEILLTRADTFPYGAYDLHLADDGTFVSSLGQEPLRLLAKIAVDDLPYTDLVTADWTVANEILAEAFPIDRPAGAGWQQSTWTDGRPAAGALVTNGLMWRYPSTASNANRKRANQVSRIFLCSDYLTREIDFDRNVNLLDQEAVLDALTTNPACVSCHASLDPIGSYFYGFWWYSEDSVIEAKTYHPDRENEWEVVTGIEPGYHGEPGRSLQDLGVQIASDPRFVECAVDQAFELLLRRDTDLEDFDQLTLHREAFLDGGLTVRALFRSILADAEYRAANTSLPGAASKKLLSPDALAAQVEGLTGYRWTYAGGDMMASDALGVRTLAGGADGTSVTTVSDLPNSTSVLVQQRLAEGAVAHLFATDPSTLLTKVDFTETPDTDRDVMADQLVDLHLVVLGQEVTADGEEITAELALWEELFAATGTAEDAWAGVVYALFRDPDFALY